ncbi:uncharacterized protein LOC143858323 [Tasmannia lanceolata]|uniref:uncharacterized protein LOC143858323 n=1 Tax=Tasmannia lanceolata TaxID=3420 RepID=UPI004062F516
MVYMNMFNTDHQMGPRISFSNDFIIDTVDHHTIKPERSASQPSDFEFSVTNYNMITADELFFKGRLLPLKDNCTNKLHKMTLRDELRIHDEDINGSLMRPPKSPIRWKEFLGLKKNHILGKKNEKNDGSLEEGRVVTKVSQEIRRVEVARLGDVEIII